MIAPLLLSLLACAGKTPPTPATPLPEPAKEAVAPELAAAEVVAFIEACFHWLGEEPYDQERAAEISAGAKASCDKAKSGTIAHYAELKGDPVAAAWIVDLLAHVGANDGLEVFGPDPELCAAAMVHYTGLSESEERYLPYFGMRCPEQAEELCGPGRCN